MCGGVGVLPLSRRGVVCGGVEFCRFRGAELCVAAWEILGDFERLWEILGIFLCRFKTASQHQTVLLTVKAAILSPKPSQYFSIHPKPPSTVPPAYAAPPRSHLPYRPRMRLVAIRNIGLRERKKRQKKWHPHRDSNPGCRDENPVS